MTVRTFLPKRAKTTVRTFLPERAKTTVWLEAAKMAPAMKGATAPARYDMDSSIPHLGQISLLISMINKQIHGLLININMTYLVKNI